MYYTDTVHPQSKFTSCIGSACCVDPRVDMVITTCLSNNVEIDSTVT